jgi:hypothetical protein
LADFNFGLFFRLTVETGFLHYTGRVRTPLGPPWKALSNAGRPGVVGEDCLRAKPEFRSHPAFRVAQGTGEAGAALGVAFFFGYFLLGEARRKYARQQGGNPSQFSD